MEAFIGPDGDGKLNYKAVYVEGAIVNTVDIVFVYRTCKVSREEHVENEHQNSILQDIILVRVSDLGGDRRLKLFDLRIGN